PNCGGAMSSDDGAKRPDRGTDTAPVVVDHEPGGQPVVRAVDSDGAATSHAPPGVSGGGHVGPPTGITNGPVTTGSPRSTLVVPALMIRKLWLRDGSGGGR